MTAVIDHQEIGFSTSQVCRIVGCSTRQVDYWDRTGLISPAVASANGSGTSRRYSHRDLLLLLVVTDLLNDARTGHRGQGHRAIGRLRPVVDYLRPKLDGDLSDAVLVIVGDRHAFARSVREVVSVVRSATETLTVVKLGQLEERIAASILRSFPVVARRSSQPSGKWAEGTGAGPLDAERLPALARRHGAPPS